MVINQRHQHGIQRCREEGIALVTVLFSVVLVALMVVSYVLLAASELKSSTLHRDALKSRQLADMAVNLVIAQLRQATVSPDGLDDPTAWVSQPGAIRVWDLETQQPDKLFKLYSSSAKVVDISDEGMRSSFVDGELQTLENWDGDGMASVRFVDLNEPMVKRLVGGEVETHFPILDPSAINRGVEGFSVDASRLAGTTIVGGEDDRIPMPVEWIYVLEDGTMGTLDAATGKFSSSEGILAGRDNRIAARIAYWTDDESCKLNLNTASEGIFWDTPRAATPEDITYAKMLPVKNEVQRFPGHPATTCLSTVFFPGENLDAARSTDQEKFKEIYDLVPAVNYNQAGGNVTGFMSGDGSTRQRRPVAFDEDRLYATVDEALFRVDREDNQIFSRIDKSLLNGNRFFLTANSRAPEVNRFGMPRHCLWPVHSRNHESDYAKYTTPYDRVVAFASTIGKFGGFGEGRYYHGRGVGGAWSQQWAFGGGGRPGTNFQVRNSYLYKDYLRHFARQPVPGYGGTFYDKYGLGIDLGLWFMTDYIRFTNLHDTTALATGSRVTPFITSYESATGQGIGLGGQINIINLTGLSSLGLNDFRGIARTYTISEVGLAFICIADKGKNVGPQAILDMLGPGEKAVQPALLVEGFSPGQGYHFTRPGFGLDLQSIGTLKVNGRTAEAPDGEPTGWKTGVWTWKDLPDHWVGWGGSGGYHMYSSVYAGGSNTPNTSLGLHEKGFFRIGSDDDILRIDSLTLNLAVRRYWSGSGIIGQTFRFTFPAGTFPEPELDPSRPEMIGWEKRFEAAKQSPDGNILLSGDFDVVRTLVPPHGDYRHVVCWYYYRPENGALPFVPHPHYADTSRFHAHSLMVSGGDASVIPEAEFPSRSLVANVTYPREKLPDFPIGPDHPSWAAVPAGYPFSNDPSVTRDWDNGTGIAPDGAYTSKPDDSGVLNDGEVPPYFHSKFEALGVATAAGEELIAPNRMMTSAAQFGSLPSLVDQCVPWTTYLFRPDVSGSGHIGQAGASMTTRSGGNAPPDHMLLDWFWMPVVQPYAISEPFSTAGKVNMNYQILPFSHIRRATGMHAVLKSERMLAIPTAAANTYKNYDAAAGNKGWRRRINSDATLVQFEDKFEAGDVFLSASEICEQFLVPEGASGGISSTSDIRSTMRMFWAEHALTGDNVLERPYSNIYPRLCTRSNIFRVHYKVQTLKKARSSDPEMFDPERDSVASEFQGSTLVERYIVPNDPGIPDYVETIRNGGSPSPMDRFYRFRILHQRRFAP